MQTLLLLIIYFHYFQKYLQEQKCSFFLLSIFNLMEKKKDTLRYILKGENVDYVE